MASLNKVMLIGNLGKDPDLKYTPQGRAVCTFSIATTEHFKDKGGAKQEKTEWHRVITWGDQAENCSKYLAKGRSVYVEGRIQSRTWDDKDGSKKSITEIVADKVTFLGGGNGREQAAQPRQPRWGDTDDTDSTSRETGNDDIPF